MTKSIFYVDINPKTIVTGMCLRKMVIDDDKISIEKEETHYGVIRILIEGGFIFKTILFIAYLITIFIIFKLIIVTSMLYRIIVVSVLGVVFLYIGNSISKKVENKKNEEKITVEDDGFFEIPFSSIESIQIRKIGLKDIAIDLKYGGEKISFWAANKYEPLNEETQKLYDFLINLKK